MPVWKYRRIEDVPAPSLTKTPGDSLRAAFEWSEVSAKLAGIAPRPGVQRFRSIEEANAERQRVDRDRAQARNEVQDRIASSEPVKLSRPASEFIREERADRERRR